MVGLLRTPRDPEQTHNPPHEGGGAVRPRAAQARSSTSWQACPSREPEVPPSPEAPSSASVGANEHHRPYLGPQRARGTPADKQSAPAYLNWKRKMQKLNAPKISRKTRAELNVTAININGRGARSIKDRNHKWHDLHRMMHDDKIGVLVVGETHLSDDQVDEIQSSHLGNRMKVHNSIDAEHPNSMGIAVVLNHDLTNTKDTKVVPLIPGRAILVTVPWHNSETITILAIYAPADSAAANQKFWEELHKIWMTRNLSVPDMMLGDTNIVEDAIDRLPHKRDDDGATNALAKFKRLLELKDGWRATYPETKAYTYTHTNGESSSRLDRVYVSPELFKNCRNWKISDVGTLMDHRAVSVVIR